MNVLNISRNTSQRKTNHKGRRDSPLIKIESVNKFSMWKSIIKIETDMKEYSVYLFHKEEKVTMISAVKKIQVNSEMV